MMFRKIMIGDIVELLPINNRARQLRKQHGFIEWEVVGIREKVIAAKRAGISELILPKDNERDYVEIPEYIKDGIEVHFVSQFSGVVSLSLAS